jgi:hypothetical protein
MLRTAGILLAATLLVAGIVDASSRGLADAYYTGARLTLAAGTPAKGAPQSAALASATASIHQARALEPANPHYVEQAARLQEMSALGLQAEDPALGDGLKQSLAKYREAALMRPGSPYVWASIATLKARLDELDYEFYGSLQRADSLGRWEPAVQLAIVDIGLARWRLLPYSPKLLVLGAVERGMRRQEAAVRRIAKASGSLGRLCAEEITLRGTPTGICVKK